MIKNTKIILILVIVMILTGCSNGNNKNRTSNEDNQSILNIGNSPQSNHIVEETTSISPFTWNEKATGIHLGMEMDEVIELLGAPENKEIYNSESEGKITILEYKSKKIIANKNLNNIVTSIIVEKNNETIVRDIKIGDNVEKLNNKFYSEIVELSKNKKEVVAQSDKATIYYDEDEDMYTVTYYDPNYNYISLTFEIKKNIIVKATLTYQTV